MALYELDGQSPELPDQCFVADSAALVGRVRLHRDASIWFGVVARGDNEWIEIGEGANVQDNCVMHTDPGFPLSVGARCTIGHNVILHGCSIGERSLIGMGAVLMNGVRIGRDCIVGAGAIVTEGKEFPDRSLIIGAPAKLVRSLDDKAVNFLPVSAQVYIDNGRRYAKGVRRIG
ncbi:MAG: gamma carbonic anhydrase family protein [Xanthobacteraceae bacterium]|nr:MAG: gamma carbonic anhydrase family protein [Xanthobacteraceae bacterium]